MLDRSIKKDCHKYVHKKFKKQIAFIPNSKPTTDYQNNLVNTVYHIMIEKINKLHFILLLDLSQDFNKLLIISPMVSNLAISCF